MAILNDGLFGGFRGKIGNMVYYRVKGKTVVRKVGRITVPPTEKQLACRQKIKVLGTFFKLIRPFINLGFERAVKGTTLSPTNAAVKYNIKEGLKGDYPDIELNFPRLLLSRGYLSECAFLGVEPQEGGIRIEWNMNAMESGTDRIMLLIYFPKCNEVVYFLTGEQRRSLGQFVPLNPAQLQQEMHLYIAFSAEGSNMVSNSRYLYLPGF